MLNEDVFNSGDVIDLRVIAAIADSVIIAIDPLTFEELYVMYDVMTNVTKFVVKKPTGMLVNETIDTAHQAIVMTRVERQLDTCAMMVHSVVLNKMLLLRWVCRKSTMGL